VDHREALRLLDAVAAGATSPQKALDVLIAGPLSPDGSVDLGFAKLDTHRGIRTGDPEVIYAAGKTTEQTIALLRVLADSPGERPAVATRVSPDTMSAIRTVFPGADIDAAARAVAIGTPPLSRGSVCVVAAGTSDGPVAAEAAFVARVFGAGVTRVDDVGVAGIHRLLAVRDRLDSVDCLIVVAGMDGALPSVVGGLVGVPLVAVPTSVGYGTGTGGVAALNTMLNACAPGVVVCNIDNGFGAGVFAARVARRAAQRESRP
jgi:pyridinium-3,5-biscarboxylic acid mononucleotide synthase